MEGNSAHRHRCRPRPGACPIGPAPPGLPHHAWYFFSIFVGVIVGLVLEPLPGAAIAIVGITVAAVLSPFVLFSSEQLSAPGFRSPSAALNWALSGYSNPTVWLIFGAFILALGYERTGLGERIALLLVKRMGKNTLLLGCGVTLAERFRRRSCCFLLCASSATRSMRRRGLNATLSWLGARIFRTQRR
jgi:hypothetical protein